MTNEELEIRKAQWNLFTEVYLLILRDSLEIVDGESKSKAQWQDKCYDAAAYATESLALFNDHFAGRNIGSNIHETRLKKRAEDRAANRCNTLYDISHSLVPKREK